MVRAGGWLGVLFGLALAVPAAADTEVAGPLPGGQLAYVLGLTCSARNAEVGAQTIILQILRDDGTLAANLGSPTVAGGATATITAKGAAVGFGGSFTCIAAASGALAMTFSSNGYGGDPEVISVGRNP